ncbi:MAG: HNH endonuclease [Actinobacteria bacterium]|nr:HNH endonuclease [Actinomycetota bacterium]
MKVKRNCEICGKEFYTIPYLIKKGWSRFCSQKCSGIWKSKNFSGKNHYKWREKAKYKCQICGKEKEIIPSRIKKKYGRFCSKKCQGISERNGKLMKCKICGKERYVNKSLIKMGGGKYCSKKCFGKGNSKENCYLWKGGVSEIKNLIKASLKYKQWRQDIYIRDKFTCQECGDNTGGNLEAHHIKPFAILLTEVKKYLPLLNLYDGAMTYNPLWNINNGITLCQKCHSKKPKGWEIYKEFNYGRNQDIC